MDTLRIRNRDSNIISIENNKNTSCTENQGKTTYISKLISMGSGASGYATGWRQGIRSEHVSLSKLMF